MGRPKKQIPKRISGTGYNPLTMEGKAAIRQLKYGTFGVDGTFEIDVDKIAEVVNAYIEGHIRPANGEEDKVEQLPISRVGLRLALEISRDTYARWLQGYVSQNDIDDENVKPNIELSEAIRAGDDRIMQYLVETCDKYGDTKRIRLLETYGEIGPAQTKTEISASISLGKWSKMGK
mgnify:CR=1 FL=1